MIKFKTAFTLVELLVVIAIVGILSGLIIVGMSSSVNSAKIAKAQIFSSSLRDSLLASLVSEWKFDSISGTVDSALADGTSVIDSWGLNNGTTVGGPILKNNSSCIYGQCLQFDGTDDGVDIPDNASLGIQYATVELWLKWDNSGSASRPYIFDSRGHKYMIFIDKPYALTMSAYIGGTIYAAVSNESTLTDGKWHHIAGTYDGASLKLYYDSALRQTTAQSGTIDLGGGIARIGGYIGGGDYRAKGLIDNVRVYKSPISASKIELHYCEGLKRLLAKNQITHEDYQEMLAKLILD